MRHFRLCFLLALLLVPALAGAQPPTPSPDEFQPISEVPPGEQIPAMNLVGAAYGFVWLALVGYVWSLGRRLQKTETDLARLERKGP